MSHQGAGCTILPGTAIQKGVNSEKKYFEVE